MDHLWAGWRTTYISGIAGGPPPGEGSLFERIIGSGAPDRETGILWHGQTCVAMLNAYPYTTGHLMVLPRRAVAELGGLDEHEATELWVGVRQAVAAVTSAYHPQGINVGANLGLAAGAGVPDHLHVHVLPRWSGDTNFMTTVAQARVLPEPLDVTWEKLVEHWPTASR